VSCRLRIFGLLSAAALVVLPFVARAHDIPNDVTVQMFVKPEGQHLRILVRVPLKAMRDILFPQRGPGYLDLERTAPLLPGAAKLWIAGFFEVYEGDALLPNPQVMATRISLPSDFTRRRSRMLANRHCAIPRT
jgi:hypothetical protein